MPLSQVQVLPARRMRLAAQENRRLRREPALRPAAVQPEKKTDWVERTQPASRQTGMPLRRDARTVALPAALQMATTLLELEVVRRCPAVRARQSVSEPTR
jgi:hypothetical protein